MKRFRAGFLVTVVLLLTGFVPWVAPATAAGTTSGAVTVSKTVNRTYVDDGKQTVVDSRHVSMTVSATQNLKSLQEIKVQWTGAHPTQGTYADQNSDFAQNEEYSFMLVECRGLDSASAPLSPKTCWTNYADERFQYGYNTSYPAWRSDLYAPQAERSAVVGATAADLQNAECRNTLIGVSNERWVPYVAADGTTYDGGPFGCAGQPAEASASNSSNLSLPSNETFGVSDASGNGTANFDVFTADDHASLGCSQTVPCSLVAVPIEGISCDAAGTSGAREAEPPADSDLTDAQKQCETTGKFGVGQQIFTGNGLSGAAAVDGTLWWSASNWRNRLSVPLGFAPSDNACSLTNEPSQATVYGSELMNQTSIQWAPHFCLDKSLFNLKHVQTSEPEARSLLASRSGVDAAYTSNASGTTYTFPVVNAPVAVSGFGIAFDIDDASKNPLTQLKLDPRLIAKLLSESYSVNPSIRSAYPAEKDGTQTVGGNPYNITLDPEFQALNPDVPKLQNGPGAAATLLSLSSDSDVVHALSSYINADPEARAWLDGQPDPWGMRVNPAYKGITLPVDNWPLLDSFEPTAYYKSGVNACTTQSDPGPYFNLVAAPVSTLFAIGQDMQFAIAQSQLTCALLDPSGSLDGAKLVPDGRQAVGARFMLGIVSLGDAARENLSVASLETHSTVSATAKFSTSAGRTFAQADGAGLRAAAARFTPTTDTRSWALPYSTLRTDSDASSAYPGTLPIFVSVPTSGLRDTSGKPSSEAGNYAKLLLFAAGPGQVQGPGQGQLAAGFLPMTAANGLSREVAYTLAAATAVAAQSGMVPQLLTPSIPVASSSGRTSTGTATTSSGTSSGSNASAGTPAGGTDGNAQSARTGSAAGDGAPAGSSDGSSAARPSTSAGATSGAPATRTVAYTRPSDAGPTGWIVRALAAVAVIGGIGVGLMRLLARAPR